MRFLQAFGYALVFNLVMCSLALVAMTTPAGEKAGVAVIGFCLGAAVGSFLNLFVYRLRSGVPITGSPSHCPKCKAPIRKRHNIPVLSWFWLRGRCAACKTAISWHYPAVEVLTGCVGAAVALAIWALTS